MGIRGIVNYEVWKLVGTPLHFEANTHAEGTKVTSVTLNSLAQSTELAVGILGGCAHYDSTEAKPLLIAD